MMADAIPSHSEQKRSLLAGDLQPENSSQQQKDRVRKSERLLSSTDRTVTRIRLTLRILSLLITLGIVIVLGHAVSIYYSTKDKVMMDESLHAELRVWPNNFKTKPTLLLLGVASAATFLSGLLCLASISKAVCSSNLFRRGLR
jgi:hypothetical protein